MNKIKILVIPSDTVGGVGFYRSFQPHRAILENYENDFDVSITTEPDWKNLEALEQFDIIALHKGLYPDMKAFYDALVYLKSKKTVVVVDIDDCWELGETHPQHLMQKKYKLDEITLNNLRMADYVTTTTPLFAQEIYPYNKHVVVLPNAIDPNDPSFTTHKSKSDKIRFGFVMGSCHEYDVQMMQNFVAKLKPETIEKIQIVLCGFDLRGKIQVLHEDGKIEERPIQPTETVWYRYENFVTNNRHIISPKHDRLLNTFVPDSEYPDVENEHYRRCWTKDMNHYYSHYDNIDVLFAPLEPKLFNYVKSQLKAIECCFSDTAIIAQNYGPYTVDLRNALDRKGNFDDTANALLVDLDKPDDWARYIEYLVEHPEKIEVLKKNIHNDLKDIYSLEAVTKKRAEFYKDITKYNKK